MHREGQAPPPLVLASLDLDLTRLFVNTPHETESALVRTFMCEEIDPCAPRLSRSSTKGGSRSERCTRLSDEQATPPPSAHGQSLRLALLQLQQKAEAPQAGTSVPASCRSSRSHMAHVSKHPKMSMITCRHAAHLRALRKQRTCVQGRAAQSRACMDVPALAGSTPARARPKGSALPTVTEHRTMSQRLDAIAHASSRDPFVMYTRSHPPAAQRGE